MPSSVALGNLEGTVEKLVASGRYNSKSEVIREGIRLVDEREQESRRRFDQLKSEMIGRGAAANLVRKDGGEI